MQLTSKVDQLPMQIDTQNYAIKAIADLAKRVLWDRRHGV